MLARPACALVLLALGGAALGACGGSVRELGVASTAYEAGDFYRALALLRIVGEDLDALDPVDRTRHAYLRGMTDARIAASLSDRHAADRARFAGCAERWLRAASEGQGLEPQERERVVSALAEVSGRERAPCGE